MTDRKLSKEYKEFRDFADREGYEYRKTYHGLEGDEIINLEFTNQNAISSALRHTLGNHGVLFEIKVLYALDTPVNNYPGDRRIRDFLKHIREREILGIHSNTLEEALIKSFNLDKEVHPEITNPKDNHKIQDGLISTRTHIYWLNSGSRDKRLKELFSRGPKIITVPFSMIDE